jgi:hypothetical protein
VTPRPYQTLEAFVARGQWQDAIALARQVGNEALAQQRFALARKTGGMLERLEDFRHSAHLMAAGMRGLERASPLPEWDGSDLAGRTLLVVSLNTHVAPATLRLGRLIAPAARRAKRCIALVEPRLLTLFRRSFPDVEVLEAGLMDAEAYRQADVMASYETLIKSVGIKDDGSIAALPALRPDPDRVIGFRNKYRSVKPLIGICWRSTNERKDVPNLDDWPPFWPNSRPRTYRSNMETCGPTSTSYVP